MQCLKNTFYVTLLLIISGCVQQQDFDTLSMRMAQQERQVADLKKGLNKTTQQLDASQPTQADLWTQVQSMRNELAMLQGQMDSLMNSEHNLPATLQEVKVLREDVTSIELALRQIESEIGLELEVLKKNTTQQISSEKASRATTQDNTPAPQASEAAESDPATQLYKQALNAFNTREYATAIRLWQEFINAFSQHKMISNATFWKGESHYQAQDYASAVLAYQEVMTKHKKSSKYLAAMLKQGLSFIKLGKTQAGKVRLQELITKYPKTPEANRAKKILEDLK